MFRKHNNYHKEEKTTLIIFVDCDAADFNWIQERCVKAVEKELDEAVENMVWLEGDINLSWKKEVAV